MARDNSYDRDALFQVSVGSSDSPYNEPTEVALGRFLLWITSTGTPGEDRYPTPRGVATGFDETHFLAAKQAPSCLYDLAYVWLVEGDAVACCPTYESWLLLLIAFVDVTRYFRDPDANGVELQMMADQPYFSGEADEVRLRELDVLHRDPAYRRGGWDDEPQRGDNAWSSHDGTKGTYQHPALRRDIYDEADAVYGRRVIYDSRSE